MRKLSILLSALLLVPAISNAATLEDLLVEKGVITKGEAKAAMATEASKVYWNDGTRIEFPDTGFTAKINTLIQTRYTFWDMDEEAPILVGDTLVSPKNRSSFDVQRARLAFSGNALHNEFYYKLEADFVGGADKDGDAWEESYFGGDEKSPELLDAYIGWKACDWLDLMMGQFKVPVSRQFMADPWGLQFADRSLTSYYFDLGRQTGLMGKLDLADGQVELGGGIFNGISTGEGANRTAVDTKHTGLVNLRWDVMGNMNPYVEGDVDWTDEAAVSLGAAYAYSDADSYMGEVELNNIDVDANLKVQGFSLHGEFYTASYDLDQGDNVEPLGFYLQAGYFFEPKTWELAARYGYVDCDEGMSAGVCAGLDKINTIDVSINYYWWKHHLKAQLGMSIVNEDTVNDDDYNFNRWLFQLSSYF